MELFLIAIFNDIEKWKGFQNNESNLMSLIIVESNKSTDDDDKVSVETFPYNSN